MTYTDGTVTYAGTVINPLAYAKVITWPPVICIRTARLEQKEGDRKVKP